GLLHRGIGQPDNHESGKTVRDVDLDRDERGLETPERAGGHARDAARGFRPVGSGDRDRDSVATRPTGAHGTTGRYRSPITQTTRGELAARVRALRARAHDTDPVRHDESLRPRFGPVRTGDRQLRAVRAAPAAAWLPLVCASASRDRS